MSQPTDAPLSSATETTPSIEDSIEEAFERGWAVIVWNDPVNLMSYVIMVFQKVLRMTQETATQHMLEVHQRGKSLVARENKERAEMLVHQLQRFGLQATMESPS